MTRSGSGFSAHDLNSLREVLRVAELPDMFLERIEQLRRTWVEGLNEAPSFWGPRLLPKGQANHVAKSKKQLAQNVLIELLEQMAERWDQFKYACLLADLYEMEPPQVGLCIRDSADAEFELIDSSTAVLADGEDTPGSAELRRIALAIQKRLESVPESKPRGRPRTKEWDAKVLLQLFLLFRDFAVEHDEAVWPRRLILAHVVLGFSQHKVDRLTRLLRQRTGIPITLPREFTGRGKKSTHDDE